jgi:hypothetical protein
MDRPEVESFLQFAKTPRCYALAGTLAVAGLLCIAWSVRSTEAKPIAAPRYLATPVSHRDLLQALNDPRREVRLEAIIYLETMNRPGADKVPALSRLFRDPDVDVRIHAVRAAIRAGMPARKGAPIAYQALTCESPEACCLAAEILGEVGPLAKKAVPQLHQCLTASSVWVRVHAARAILKIAPDDAAALPVLQLALENEQGTAQDFAADVLREVVGRTSERDQPAVFQTRPSTTIEGKQVSTEVDDIPAVVAELDDRDLLVRAHAAQTAFRAGAPAEQIIGVVSQLLIPDRLDVLREAASILAEIGPDACAALPQLHECLSSTAIAVRLYAAEATLRIDATDRIALWELRQALHHTRTDVRYFGVNALGAAVLDSDLAAFALHEAICDPHPKVATAAALLLSRTHDLPRRRLQDDPLGPANDSDLEDGSISSWIEELSQSDPAVRRTAAICLALAGRAANASVTALTECLTDHDSILRLYAAQALWEIEHDGPAIMPTLVDLLQTDSSDTRIGAVLTLGRMGRAASDALGCLTAMLTGNNSAERLLLAEAIVRIEPAHRESLYVLVRSLHSPKGDERYLATIALGAVPLAKQFAAEQAVSSSIEDRSARVRNAAYETLSQLVVRQTLSRPLGAIPLDDGDETAAVGESR